MPFNELKTGIAAKRFQLPLRREKEKTNTHTAICNR
jgi:hypothetical protein